MTKFSFFTVLLIGAITSSCIKDPKIETLPLTPAVVTFNFQAKVKNENLVPEKKKYTNASLDSFSVTKFNYYLSNIKMTREDGFIFSETESYHLMQHVDGKTSFSISGLPEGNYTKIEFMIGIDSLRNVSGARDGDLDPARNMFWDWEQGYIFFKMEGAFNSDKQPETGDYAIHIGGFKGPYACQQKCSFSLISPVSAKGGKNSSVFYNVQIDEIFVKPMLIGFDYYYENLPKGDKIFKDISNNYKDMFVIDKVVN